MKRIITIGFVVLILSCFQTRGQAPQGINYQGVARGLDGKPLAQKEISIRISILNQSENGEVEYQEIHEVKTNTFGLFTLVIGQGAPSGNDFSFIGWTSGKKWLQVELDENGGRNFKLMGSQQLMSVPYALYAERAGNGYQAGQGIVISNNMISNTGDGDNDSSNELITAVELDSNHKLRITDAGGTKEADLSGLLGASQNLSNVLAEGNSAGNLAITNLGAPVGATDAATKAYVDAHSDGDASSDNELQDLSQVLARGKNAGGSKIENLGAPSIGSDAANKAYVDSHVDGDADDTNEIQNLTQVLTEGNSAGGSRITNLGTPTLNSDATTKAYVDNLDALDGDKSSTNEIQNLSEVLTQSNNAGGTKITNLGAPTVNTDAATKQYVDNLDAADGDKSATNEIQNLTQVLAQSNNAGGTKITNLGAPTVGTDAATKLYVDNLDAADDDKSSTNEIQNLSQVLAQSNNAGGTKITNLGTPTVNTDAATKLYVDNLDAADGDKSATNEIQNLAQVLSQNNSAASSRITNLGDPTGNQDAATKKYVDDADAVLSSRISTTYAFKATFNYTNGTAGTVNDQPMPFTVGANDFDDFLVLGGTTFTAAENGTYIFYIEGFYNTAIAGGSLSLLYGGIKYPITIVLPFGATQPRFSGTFMFKLTAGQTISLIGDNIPVTAQFNGKFFGNKL